MISRTRLLKSLVKSVGMWRRAFCHGVLDGQQVRNLNDNGASGVLAAVPFQDGDDDGIGWDGLFPR